MIIAKEYSKNRNFERLDELLEKELNLIVFFSVTNL